MLSDPATIGLFRTACMVVAALGALRITHLGFSRRNSDPRWQLPMLGGLLVAAAYLGIIGMWGFNNDQFISLSQVIQPTVNVYIWLLKAGLLLVVIGAFSLAKPRRS